MIDEKYQYLKKHILKPIKHVHNIHTFILGCFLPRFTQFYTAKSWGLSMIPCTYILVQVLRNSELHKFICVFSNYYFSSPELLFKDC